MPVSSIKKIFKKSYFITDFINRDGLYVFLSTLFVQLLGAILSIVIVRIISKAEYGHVAFTLSMFTLVNVFSGFGSNWSLLRFGPIANPSYKRNALFKYSLFKGLKFSLILIIILIILSQFLPQNVSSSKYYVIICSFGLITNFVLENLKSYIRVIRLNKLYSIINIANSFSLLILGISLTILFKGYGYIISIILSPLIVFLFYFRRIKIFDNTQISIKKSEFWFYGINTGIGMIANQILFSFGPFILGYMHAPSDEIASFKVATLIPFSLLMIPGIILTTDYVHISANFRNKKIITRYYIGYFKTMVLFTFAIAIGCILLSKWLIISIFGSIYSSSINSFKIFMVGIFFAFLFRNPLGTILAALGKASWNVVNSFAMMALFLLLSIFVYPNYGIFGMSFVISFILILSGFISLLMFIYYIRNYTN